MALPPNSRRSEATSAARRVNRIMFTAGLLQIASIYSPAARVRIYGLVPFLRVSSGGVAVLALVYWRVTNNPSKTFVDPLLRHVMHPSWGFIPMEITVLISLVGAAMIRLPWRVESAPFPIDPALTVLPSTTPGA